MYLLGLITKRDIKIHNLLSIIQLHALGRNVTPKRNPKILTGLGALIFPLEDFFLFLLIVSCIMNKGTFVFLFWTEIGGDVFETSSKRGFNVGKFVTCSSQWVNWLKLIVYFEDQTFAAIVCCCHDWNMIICWVLAWENLFKVTYRQPVTSVGRAPNLDRTNIQGL